MNKFFASVIEFIKSNLKWVIIVASLVVAVAVIAVVVVLAFSQIGEKDTSDGSDDETAVVDSSDDVVEDDVVDLGILSNGKKIVRLNSDIPTLLLEEDAYEEVNQFVADYYGAVQKGNTDLVKSMVDYFDDTEMVKISKRSEYIESVNNIKVYTKLGVTEDSYIVYVYYESKFKDIESSAPALEAFYLCKDENGKLIRTQTSTDDIVTEYIKEVNIQDDVIDLFNKTNVAYNDIVNNDAVLSGFLKELPIRLKKEIGEEIAALEVAKLEAEENEQTVPNDDTSTDVDGDDEEDVPVSTTTVLVRATATVNIRVSDSLEADRIGRASVDEEFECLEQKLNGWSKVKYEDEIGYIKSDYVEVVGVVEEDPNKTYVVANTTVNIRGEASADSDKVGVANEGKKFELVEAQDNGWSKIIYNGKEVFIKSEYLD